MKKNFWRGVLILILAAAVYFLNRYDLLEKMLGWIEGFGVWGPVLFVGLFIVACLFMVPSFIFTFSSGVLFGFGQGAWLSLAGNALGSFAVFLTGRYLARDFVEKRFRGSTQFIRISEALRKKGWKVIVLARLSPVFPFAIGNYAFGTTQIPARHYLFASVLGTIPSTLLYSYLGFITGGLAAFQSSGRIRTWQEWAVLGLGLIATFALAWYLRRIAEKDLRGCR